MTTDTRIMRGRRRVPVVAFLGTKGGVGTTTIARRFGELITLAESAPNVLLVDVDVHRRGMTVEMKTQTHVACNTVHDYTVSKNVDNVEAANIPAVISGSRQNSGSLFFVPASSSDSDRVFRESASIGPENVLEILSHVVSKAVQNHDCECVVIDCGSMIDPYTGAAAVLADRAFIIGQNEPISFSSLRTYPSGIRDFYPDFRTDKMKVIINKVRGWEQLEQRKRQWQEEIFAAIPFTMDIADASEGLSETNAMQLMLFEDHIAKIIEKVFKSDYPELVPPSQSLLPPQWRSLVEDPDDLEQATPIKQLGLLSRLLPIGVSVAVLGAVVFYAASTQRHRAERAVQAEELVISLKSAVEEAEASSGASTRAMRDALRFAQAVDPGNEQSLARAVKRALEAGVKDVPPLERLDSMQENLGIGIILVGVALGALGFLCSRSRKNYLSAIKGLRVGGAEWLMSEMEAKTWTFNKLLQMVEPGTRVDERRPNLFSYVAGAAHWLSGAFVPRHRGSLAVEHSAVSEVRRQEVVYSANGKRQRAMPRSARQKQPIPSLVIRPGSVEDDFAREVRARIKQAHGCSNSLAEDLLRFAGLLGLDEHQARKVLDRTLLRLGFDNASNFDDGTNVAKFRELVGYFLASGGISPERRTILKNRAREWRVSPGVAKVVEFSERGPRAMMIVGGEGYVAKAVEFSERGPDLTDVQESRPEELNWNSPSSIQYAVKENQQPLPSQASTESQPAPLELREEIIKERHKECTERATEKSVEGEGKSRLELDPVDCTVFAPPSVGQNQTLLVQVLVHLHEQAEEARDLAVEFDPAAQRRGVKNLETKIARGTKLTFDLVMRGLEIDDPVQSLIWNGRPEGVQFGVSVPSRHPIGTVIGTVTVSQDSVPIGHIKFKLAITAASMTQSTQEAEPVGDAARRYTKAFVSYASKDLDKVRPRLQMLSLQGIDYFQDKFGLEPGDRWEKKLYVNIDQCDLFLLFWSSAAKESEWVRKEVNYALDRKGGDDFAPPEIHPVVIEGPPVPDPWQEVSHIHFDDWRIHYHA